VKNTEKKVGFGVQDLQRKGGRRKGGAGKGMGSKRGRELVGKKELC